MNFVGAFSGEVAIEKGLYYYFTQQHY